MTSNWDGSDRVGARAIPTVIRHPDIACRDTPAEIFFPPSGGSSEAAEVICRRCPHRAECLKFALDTDQRFGVWGGVNATNRRQYRRTA